ncbi:MAG: hypothetical protein ACREMQ_22640, partial [Longimicrobiales bacterium]
MSGTSAPRRAVFAADRQNGSRQLGLSHGWSDDGAAAEAVLLLETEAASIEISDFAGFLTLGRGSWAIVRGGLAPAPNPTGRYWREAVALEALDFARVRFNPFRLLPRLPPDLVQIQPQLSAPALPVTSSAAGDLDCLRELHRRVHVERTPGELEMLLAAVLEADHTLVTGSDWSYGDLEQLILMLPPRLRPELTFHTYALALPREPIPRLVMTPLHDEWPFHPETGTWGHRLPQTRSEISSHAQEAAADLIGLLDAPELLGEAHEAYERYVGRFKPKRRPLLDEVDTLLRFARLSAVRVQGEAGAALRVLSRAVGSQGTDLDESEMTCLLDILQEGFPPESMGTAVADCIRQASVNPVVTAVVLERFLSRREADPAAFAAFVRPLANVSAANLISSDERTGRRVATMLALLAAARGDAAGLVASSHPPLDREVIDKVGGIDAWASREAAVGWALRALAEARTPEDLVDALRALAGLRGEIPQGRAQIPMVELGVACMRWGYRSLPREAWEVGLQIGIAGLNLCHAVTTTGRISLDGRTDADLLKEMLDRTASLKGVDLRGHSDAEVFFGFLGVQASRSRPALWEIPERGDPLVKELFERIRKSVRRDENPGEGIHWSLALLDRVRRHEVDGQYVPLAAQLLRLSAGSSARDILRWYLEAYPALGARIREDASSHGLVDDRDLRAAADVPGEAEPAAAAVAA